MRTRLLALVLSSLAMLAVGCATMADAQNSVRNRAAFDLSCNELQVTDLPGRAYGVEGCGMRAVYVFASPDCSAPTQHGRKEFTDACTPTLDHIVHAHGKGMHGKGEHGKHGKGGEHCEHCKNCPHCKHHGGKGPDADAPKATADDPEAPTARDPDTPPAEAAKPAEEKKSD